MIPVLDTKSIEQRLEALRNSQGQVVNTLDLVQVVESMVFSMRKDLYETSEKIGGELNELVEFINSAKSEIALIRPRAMSTQDIPGAADELDAVVAHTEEAAGAIMDCADELMNLSATVGPELAEKLQLLSTRIFEASSFQDITGQRVTKVVRTLKHIEARLGQLAETFGDTHAPETKKVETDADGIPIDPKDLLNGPQLPTAANGQDDIDALLASFD